MRKLFLTGLALTMASSAFAAPNVTNATQKGSLLVFSDIRVDNTWNTLVRIQNDGSSDIDLKCYYMDGHKNRVDFILPVTKNQPVWFEAKTGRGSTNVNLFPTAAANGFTVFNKHPFLGGAEPLVADLGWNAATTSGYGVYGRGLLACWVIDGGAMNQVKWNHISGTATVFNTDRAYEYNAYAFFVPTGTDLAPIGVAGSLNLNGLEYDACPLYMIGQFSPVAAPNAFAPVVNRNRLAVNSCNLNLNQDWTPVWTKLQFDVWNAEEVKFTGAYECSDSWHETTFVAGTISQPNGVVTPGVPGFIDGIDAAGQNFAFNTLGTYSARYRVQGIKSTQCERIKSGAADSVAAVTTQAVGIIGVQSSHLAIGDAVGTTLAAAGKMNGRIQWDPEGAVPEGSIR